MFLSHMNSSGKQCRWCNHIQISGMTFSNTVIASDELHLVRGKTAMIGMWVLRQAVDLTVVTLG